MLLLKRLGTAAVLAGILFVIFFIGGLAVGGGIAGARAVRAHPDKTPAEAGREAGQEFGRKYGAVMFLGAMGGAGVVSFAISFSGLLPWCRKEKAPPAI